jgi:hypothetical protein
VIAHCRRISSIARNMVTESASVSVASVPEIVAVVGVVPNR